MRKGQVVYCAEPQGERPANTPARAGTTTTVPDVDEATDTRNDERFTMTSPARRLTRSRRSKVVAGVCGGLAERYGLSAGLVRLLFVLSCILPGPQFVIYLILWIAIPKAAY